MRCLPFVAASCLVLQIVGAGAPELTADAESVAVTSQRRVRDIDRLAAWVNAVNETSARRCRQRRVAAGLVVGVGTGVGLAFMALH